MLFAKLAAFAYLTSDIMKSLLSTRWTFQEYYQILKDMLQCLREAELTEKSTKVTFMS